MFDLADMWAHRTGSLVRLVSANDHHHRRGSAHYAGLALDLHSSNPDGLAAFFREIGYRVLWRVPGHYGHLHVQEPNLALPPEATANSQRVPTQPPARGVALAGTETRPMTNGQ